MKPKIMLSTAVIAGLLAAETPLPRKEWVRCPEFSQNDHLPEQDRSPVHATTSVPFGLSGGASVGEDFYRLHLRADKGQQWIYLIGLGPQPMYGRCRPENVRAFLETSVGLPSAQTEAIRRSVMNGKENEVGGRVSGAIRVFTEKQLREIGMSFRPLET